MSRATLIETMKPVSIQRGLRTARGDEIAEDGTRREACDARATVGERTTSSFHGGVGLRLGEPLGMDLEELAKYPVLRPKLARELGGKGSATAGKAAKIVSRAALSTVARVLSSLP